MKENDDHFTFYPDITSCIWKMQSFPICDEKQDVPLTGTILLLILRIGPDRVLFLIPHRG
jgi:hypothetical protein